MAVADTGGMAKAAHLATPRIASCCQAQNFTSRRLSGDIRDGSHARRVFDRVRQQGLRSLEHLSDPNSGEVRLGCTDIILHSLVPSPSGSRQSIYLSVMERAGRHEDRGRGRGRDTFERQLRGIFLYLSRRLALSLAPWCLAYTNWRTRHDSNVWPSPSEGNDRC